MWTKIQDVQAQRSDKGPSGAEVRKRSRGLRLSPIFTTYKATYLNWKRISKYAITLPIERSNLVMLIEFDTRDVSLIMEIIETFHENYEKSLPEPVKLTIKPPSENSTLTRSSVLFDTIAFTLTNFVSPVAINLMSSWLYDALKGRAKRLRIDEKEVLIEREEIMNALGEVISRTERTHFTQKTMTSEE
jgi:hypothetical protein